MRLRTKLAALAVTAGIGLAATGAFAYWSTTGSGDGSASVAGSNGVLSLDASIDVPETGMVPGEEYEVSFTATNPGSTDLRLGTISRSSVVITKAEGNTGACSAADFTMADVLANQTIVGHEEDPQAVTATGTLVFHNDAINSQDGCKNASIALNVTSN